MIIKRGIRWTLILIAAIYLMTDVYLWIAYSPGKYEKEISEVVRMAKTAPQLPEKVFSAYEKVYPGSLRSHIVPDLLWIAQTRSFGHYPQCWIAQRILQPFTGKLQVYMCANDIENRLTNKECLNLLLHQFDFLHTAIGIEKAAQKYYHKNVEELSKLECLELIVMTINPFLFNKFTHPDKLEVMVRRYI